MIKQDVIIQNQLGLHARPATLLAKTALKYQSIIKIEMDGKSADATSVLGLLMLGSAKDKSVIISADGEDEIEALQAICDLINNGFNE